jgi:hypothetical protein
MHTNASDELQARWKLFQVGQAITLTTSATLTAHYLKLFSGQNIFYMIKNRKGIARVITHIDQPVFP